MAITAVVSVGASVAPTLVASSPWWAAPAGVIVGALIGLAAGVYNTRRRRLDEAAASALDREQRLIDEQRAAAMAFLAASHRLRSALPHVEKMEPALHELEEQLARVQIMCSTAIAGEAIAVSVRSRLLLTCAVQQDLQGLKEQTDALFRSQRKFLDKARELAGYPPVDQEARRDAEEEVDRWLIQQEFDDD